MDKELLREFRVFSGVTSRLPTITEARLPKSLHGFNKPVSRGSMPPGTWHLSKDGRVFYATKTQKNGSAAGILFGHNGNKFAKTQVRPEEMGQWQAAPESKVVDAYNQNIVDGIKDYAGDVAESVDEAAMPKLSAGDLKALYATSRPGGTHAQNIPVRSWEKLEKLGYIEGSKTGSPFLYATPAGLEALRAAKSSKPATEGRKFVPSWRPAYEAEVDADFAKAHAATSQAEIGAIFEKLKTGQTVWMAFSAVMSTGDKSFQPYTVGRRSLSKKYNNVTVSLLRAGQKSAGGMMRIALMRRAGGNVQVALGDMGASLLGLYVP